MTKSICNLDKLIFIKTILLISAVFLIIYLLNYASSSNIREAFPTTSGIAGKWTQVGCPPPQSDCIVTFTDAGPCPAGSGVGCPAGAVAVVGNGTKNLWPGRTGNGFVAGKTLTFMFNNGIALKAAISDNKITWQNGVVWTKVLPKPSPKPQPDPKPTPTTLQSSPTLEACKKKCVEHQAAGCKGVVYDAVDKTCWLKNFFAGEGEAKANRQAFILNPGCPKPKIPVPPPKPACCKGWQQTLNCSGSGPPDTRSAFLQSSTHGSHGCSVNIPSGASGYCTCKDGKKLLFDCGHSGFNCEEQCAKNCTEPPVQPIHVTPPSASASAPVSPDSPKCKTPPAPHPPPPPTGSCKAKPNLGFLQNIWKNNCENNGAINANKAACTKFPNCQWV